MRAQESITNLPRTSFDSDLPELNINDLNMRDLLTSNKYNWKNISLDPFKVIWLTSL